MSSLPGEITPDARTMIATLVEDLAEAPAGSALVLDDYHEIQNQDVHDAVNYLVDNLPDDVVLVIVTRADPPLPLARLRSQGRLIDIRGSELRFTEHEVAEYYRRTAGIDLDAAQTQIIAQRSEGWVSALQLASLGFDHIDPSRIAASLSAQHGHIASYLGDDVGASLALGNLAEAAARAGDVERARDGYRESIKASYALNSTHRTVEAITLSAVFEMSIDEPARAIVLLDDAIDLARSRDLPFWDDFGLALRAVATHDLGLPGALEQFTDHATKLFADSEFRATFYYQMPLVLGRADLELTAGNPDRAAMLLGALEVFERENSPMEPIFEGTRRRRLFESLEAELGVDGFAEARTRGGTLSRGEASRLTADP